MDWTTIAYMLTGAAAGLIAGALLTAWTGCAAGLGIVVGAAVARMRTPSDP